jgi:hypothetical protein
MEIEEFENFDGSRWLRAEPTKARIAALEAQIARLPAPVTEAEVVAAVGTYVAMGRGSDAGHAALTAFLERRMKG